MEIFFDGARGRGETVWSGLTVRSPGLMVPLLTWGVTELPPPVYSPVKAPPSTCEKSMVGSLSLGRGDAPLGLRRKKLYIEPCWT